MFTETGQTPKTKDRQADNVIAALMKIAAQVERRWHNYIVLPPEGRVRAADSLLANIDRLTNLIDLAEVGDFSGIVTDSHKRLLGEVARVRARLAAVGVSLVIERIKGMRVEIEQCGKSGVHPLGKSLLWRQTFLRYAGHLRRFAVTRMLPGDWEAVRETVDCINRLSDVDRKLPWFRSLGTEGDDLALGVDEQTMKVFSTFGGDAGKRRNDFSEGYKT